MIEGLKVRIEGPELKQHIQARATHHKDRADHYLDKAAKEAVDQEIANQQVSGGNVLQQYQAKAREHVAKNEHFQFMADHIVVAETYQLDHDDLIKLEIITRQW